MDRREFVSGIAFGLPAAPLATEAQQAGKVWRIGLVSIGSDPARPVAWQPFLEAMRELGYVEGGNLAVKGAFAKGRVEDLPRLVGELLRSDVNVMVTTGTRETIAPGMPHPPSPS